jgi:hypothetical protein
MRMDADPAAQHARAKGKEVEMDEVEHTIGQSLMPYTLMQLIDRISFQRTTILSASILSSLTLASLFLSGSLPPTPLDALLTH